MSRFKKKSTVRRSVIPKDQGVYETYNSHARVRFFKTMEIKYEKSDEELVYSKEDADKTKHFRGVLELPYNEQMMGYKERSKMVIHVYEKLENDHLEKLNVTRQYMEDKATTEISLNDENIEIMNYDLLRQSNQPKMGTYEAIKRKNGEIKLLKKSDIKGINIRSHIFQIKIEGIAKEEREIGKTQKVIIVVEVGLDKLRVTNEMCMKRTMEGLEIQHRVIGRIAEESELRECIKKNDRILLYFRESINERHELLIIDENIPKCCYPKEKAHFVTIAREDHEIEYSFIVATKTQQIANNQFFIEEGIIITPSEDFSVMSERMRIVSSNVLFLKYEKFDMIVPQLDTLLELSNEDTIIARYPLRYENRYLFKIPSAVSYPITCIKDQDQISDNQIQYQYDIKNTTGKKMETRIFDKVPEGFEFYKSTNSRVEHFHGNCLLLKVDVPSTEAVSTGLSCSVIVEFIKSGFQGVTDTEEDKIETNEDEDETIYISRSVRKSKSKKSNSSTGSGGFNLFRF